MIQTLKENIDIINQVEEKSSDKTFWMPVTIGGKEEEIFIDVDELKELLKLIEQNEQE